MALITVIICTHNPRMEILGRTLGSLRKQTLAQSEWELLLVDNRSDSPLRSEVLDLNWHRQSRIVREETLGLTAARLRAIREANGDLLLFVDDDNLLAEDYLEEAISIHGTHPWIGIFGGSVRGEFETPPPPFLTPYLDALAVDEINRSYWSNIPEWSKACPFGAGLVITRQAALHYQASVCENNIALKLDRIGKSLASAGDTHMAFATTELGLGMGRFASLRLTHLIPGNRLQLPYFFQLKQGMFHSNMLLQYLLTGKRHPPAPALLFHAKRLVLLAHAHAACLNKPVYLKRKLRYVYFCASRQAALDASRLESPASA